MKPLLTVLLSCGLCVHFARMQIHIKFYTWLIFIPWAMLLTLLCINRHRASRSAAHGAIAYVEQIEGPPDTSILTMSRYVGATEKNEVRKGLHRTQTDVVVRATTILLSNYRVRPRFS